MSDLNYLKGQIWCALVTKAFGRAQAMLRARLLEALRSRIPDLSDVEMRDVVSEMVSVDKAPIGTCGQGYYINAEAADFQDAIEMLNKQSASIAIRKNVLISLKELATLHSQGYRAALNKPYTEALNALGGLDADPQADLL